ncbi:DapH/DapD/GlmU-related protein [Bradyrhizobium liaoningense]|uniref:acyltransferase n=1 Tax=Bradyrhizobium liaoningense TaxID=43992 RepID=UPI001BA8EDCE|nr:acyltransferase [Bradyrhizobium liaoningense]MBR1033914.1 acyltransferase [Bradyrhizobium liaoningense]
MARSARLGRSARILNAGNRSELIRIGQDSVVNGELFVFAHGGSIQIGKGCVIESGARIWSAGSIKIGNGSFVSHDVNIFDSLTHPLDPAKRHEQIRAIFSTGHPKEIDLDEKPVEIGNNVFIGQRAMILRGVKIGAWAVVQPGSIVTKDIPC